MSSVENEKALADIAARYMSTEQSPVEFGRLSASPFKDDQNFYTDPGVFYNDKTRLFVFDRHDVKFANHDMMVDIKENKTINGSILSVVRENIVIWGFADHVVMATVDAKVLYGLMTHIGKPPWDKEENNET